MRVKEGGRRGGREEGRREEGAGERRFTGVCQAGVR